MAYDLGFLGATSTISFTNLAVSLPGKSVFLLQLCIKHVEPPKPLGSKPKDERMDGLSLVVKSYELRQLVLTAYN